MRSSDTAGTPLVVVPVGSLEQHGPHLPLDTDTRIATAVADAADAVLAPAIAYGASGEHEGFGGTVSLGTEAMTAVLIEYGRSVCMWAQRVVFVNGHGGNVDALVSAVRQLRYEGRDIAWFACAVPGGDSHAGRAETSVLLHLAPECVAHSLLEAGNVDAVDTLMARMREGGVGAVSPNGVLGDPRGANADEGLRMLDSMSRALLVSISAWTPDDRGRL
ncbi:mycofactocin biosynthesis peptidyl-dipeptidase MftE [Rhodococcus fascians]|nr:mycofactocin biosynthesis peptidyl-dipeptidase MftE [Rhodococcus fascians]MBY3995239.1 mycofactocin biosynthesis peptidyl-dipeptidase MftE [Rhodococcus fascians]MBY4000441.1 mycofactocin biosynthesis peptidyl-dipeptidase MftE [Rhodococcus fascians]MBY4005469.1 mycofactocin biosynthesis peptidyl-dipeptidase MftE [Rhodococcus fascians]MBY4016302.1 mycofactocin biosynthesis peptidyl-dipeptidase MftE [Rhodococcus fascians]